MRRHMVTWVGILALGLVETGPPAPAQGASPPQEQVQYTVRKGDTLWDLSAHFLQDPFRWPRIWQANPQIQNPDLIFPGQILRIPLLTPPAPPGPKAPPAPSPPPLAAPPPVPLLKGDQVEPVGYVTRSLSGVGILEASLDGRMILGPGDRVVLHMNRGQTPTLGDRFWVLRKGETIDHPQTHRFVGYEVIVVGVVEVIRVSPSLVVAQVVRAYRDLFPGDLLQPYQALPDVFPPETPPPSVEGWILALQEARILGGNQDILYLDLGEATGLRPGHHLQVLRYGEPVAEILILRVLPHTATGKVLWSQEHLQPGDPVRPLS